MESIDETEVAKQTFRWQEDRLDNHQSATLSLSDLRKGSLPFGRHKGVTPMRLLVLPLAAALLEAVSARPSFAQESARQQQQAQQTAANEAAERAELLQQVQPVADRYAEAMVTRNYSDPLVQAYVNSLGQSLVPPQTPASTTFSFRVVQDIYPHAVALPDGRIYVTTGMLAYVGNEAQLAMVLGHEIGHVIQEHSLESLRRQRASQRRNNIVAVGGGILGGILGARRGGAREAAEGAAVGAGAAARTATAVSTVVRSRYNKEQEKEADRIGAQLALAQDFDPEEAARFWERQHERFGQRSLTAKMGHLLFGSHPRERIRAEGIRALLAADLKPLIDEQRTQGTLVTGTGQFGSVISGLVRDTGALMAERSDRHDLAIELLEKARQYRPNDPRLLWALGRAYRITARSQTQLADAENFLVAAAEQDRRNMYPAIYRDLAYAVASRSEDREAAAEYLKQYVNGHVAAHGALPPDIDDVYDKLVLFGDNQWKPSLPSAGMATSQEDDSVPAATGPPSEHGGIETIRADLPQYLTGYYHPTVWNTPARLAAYDDALRMSTQQIDFSFGGVLAQNQPDDEPPPH